MQALIFDSGVGGLSVVAEIRALMPDLRLTYVADDEFRPYGSKTEAQLLERLPGLIWTLVETVKPNLVVIACNTASTTALSAIRALCPVPVIGVVPAIKPAAKHSQTKTIAVLGTPGTVKRRYVDGLIETFANDCEVILHGSVDLVAQAERKLSGRSVDMDVVKAELAPIFDGPHGDTVDSIVLACTHFPLLKEALALSAPRRLAWVDSGHAIARRVRDVAAKLTPQTPIMSGPDTALLIGPDTDKARAGAFQSFGFERVVGLMPHQRLKADI